MTYAPQNTYEYRRSINVDVSDIENSFTVRQRILAILQRKTHQTLRTTLNTFRPPRYYFDDVIASLSGTSTQVLNLSGSTNPRTEGLTIGCTVNQLSGGGPSGVYGYISDISSSEVTVAWNTGSGISATDTVRFYVPVRAGDLIKHRNDPSNINQMMRVTKVTYDENNGVALTRYDVVGATSSKEGGDARMTFAAPTYSGGGETSFPFSATDVPLEDKHNKLALVFSVTDEDTVAWAAGDIYIGSKRYEIDAGNTGNMSVGISYTIYYYPGGNTFTVNTTSHYLSVKRSKYSKNIVKIATAFGVAAADGKAYFRLEPNLGTIKARDMSNAPDVLNTNSIKATLSKKGIQAWSSNASFEATGTAGEYNKIKFGLKGTIGSNATVSFSDNTTEAIAHSATGTSSLGNSSSVAAGKVTLAAGVNYIYKAIGDSASTTLVITNDYTDVYQDDRILLCMVKVASSDDGSSSPSIFPFTGNEATISAGVISAGAITADTIQANAITAAKISSGTITTAITSDMTGVTMNAAGQIMAGKSAYGSGTGYILENNSGTPRFDIGVGTDTYLRFTGSAVEVKGSITGSTGTFGNCSMGSDGFVADGELLGFQIMNGSTHYGALGYNSGAVIISTTDNDASTVTPRMYFNDTADAVVQIPPGTTAEINEHRFATYSTGGSEYATMFPVGDRDGTAGDPYGFIGVNASNAQAPYARIYAHILHPSDGTAGAPSVAFADNNDTGIYSSGTDELSITAGGEHVIRFVDAGIVAEAPFYIEDTVGSTDLPTSATVSGLGGVYSGKYWLRAVTSSARYKSDIQDYTDYIDSSKIFDLNVKTYKDLDGKNQAIGLIAEEVEEILPELVSYKFPVNKDDSNKVAEGVKGNMLEFLLLEEIKKLNKRITILEEGK